MELLILAGILATGLIFDAIFDFFGNDDDTSTDEPPVPEDDGIIHGTSDDDLLFGTGNTDVIDAGRGDDIVYGKASGDMIFGRQGGYHINTNYRYV